MHRLMANTGTPGKNPNAISAPNKYTLNEWRAQQFKQIVLILPFSIRNTVVAEFRERALVADQSFAIS